MPEASASAGELANRITPCWPITNVGRKFLTSASSIIAMRRLSSVSQRLLSRAAAARVERAMDGIVQHHDPDIVGREAGAAQGDEFCNRIILAVTAATRERCERRRPDVDLAVLGEVVDRPDGEIDGAVDFAEPGAAFAQLAASTMSRNLSAAGDTQPSRSPSQSASCTISSSSRRCTPSHLSRVRLR